MAIETSIILSAVNKASAVIGDVRDDIGGLSDPSLTQGLSTNLAGIGKVLTGVVAAGIATVSAAFLGFAADGVKGAMDLEAQMSGVAAVLGLTAEQAQPLKDLIQGLAIDPKLKVNATEAAAAIEMLARNGLGVQEIMEGAAHGTVLLANATGADFSTAANVATDVMAQFNIEGQNFGQAVDGITSVVNASKFSINDYALAISQGGGVAATAGVSFDDFNTTIAAISPLFASGSDAGTSFKTMLTAMANPSSTASSAIKELGLNFFDANGNMKDMGTIAAELNQALYGTSTVMVEVGGRTAEQNAELARLQGRYETTTRQIADYSAGILGAGLTEEARAKKLADLAAQQQNIQAAMSPLLGITGELTEATKQLTEEERTKALAQIFGSDAMRAAAGLAESGAVVYTDAATAAAALGVAHEDLAWALEGGITQYEALAIQMGQTSALDAAATRVDNLSGDMDIFSGIVEALKLQVGDALLPALRGLVQWGTKLLTAYGQPLADAFGTIVDLVGRFFDGISSGDGFLDSFLTLTSGLGDMFGFNVKEIKGFNDKIKEFFDNVSDGIQKIKDFIEPIADFLTKYVEMKDILISAGIAILAFVIPALASLIVFLAPIIATIAAVVAAVVLFRMAWESNFLGIQQIVVSLSEAFTHLIDGWKALFSGDILGAMESFKQVWTSLGEAVMTYLTNFYTAVATWASSVDWAAVGQTIIDALLSAWGFITETVLPYLAGLWTSISTWATETDWKAIGLDIITRLFNSFIALFETVAPYLTAFIASVTAWFNEQDWKAIGYDLTVKVLTGIKNLWESTSTFLSEFWGNVQAFFNDTDWGELGTTLVEKAVTKIAVFWMTAKAKFDSFYASAKSWFATTDWSSLTTSLIDGLIAGIQSGVMAVVNAAADLASGVSQAISDVWNSHSPSKWAIDKAFTIPQGIVIGLGQGEAMVDTAGADLGQAVTNSVTSGMAAGVTDNRQNVYNQTWNVNTNSLNSGREGMAALAFAGGI